MISIKVDVDGVTKAIDVFSSTLKNRETAHRQVGVQLFTWVQRNFESSGGLQPKPWAPLAPSTLKRKKAQGLSSKPLYGRTGNLRTSFLPFSDNNQVGIGARASAGVDYAEVHEYGGEDPKRNWRVPARPMLPPVKVVLDYAIRVYKLHVKSARQKARL